VADQQIPIERILRLTVESNYMEFFLKSGRVYLPYTMKQALASLSPEQGCLIHRSIWLANDNFESYRREGMELIVRTTDGLEFRVARSRQSEALPWLKHQTFLRKAGLRP
jgi:DNA-binding LytR/AlgR family response regulator